MLVSGKIEYGKSYLGVRKRKLSSGPRPVEDWGCHVQQIHHGQLPHIDSFLKVAARREARARAMGVAVGVVEGLGAEVMDAEVAREAEVVVIRTVTAAGKRRRRSPALLTNSSRGLVLGPKLMPIPAPSHAVEGALVPWSLKIKSWTFVVLSKRGLEVICLFVCLFVNELVLSMISSWGLISGRKPTTKRWRRRFQVPRNSHVYFLGEQ